MPETTRSKAMVTVRFMNGVVERLPFDDACRKVEETTVFVSPDVPTDLFAGSVPDVGLAFDYSSRKRPRTAFVSMLSPDEEVTPCSRKGAKTIAGHRRCFARKSIIVRDPNDGGKLYSWFLGDIEYWGRWVENTDLAIATLDRVVDHFKRIDEDSGLGGRRTGIRPATIFRKVLAALETRPPSRVDATSTRIAMLRLLFKVCECMEEEVSLRQICNLSPIPTTVTPHFEEFWCWIFQNVEKVPFVFTEIDGHRCLIEGPLASFFEAIQLPSVQQSSSTSLRTIATLVGKLFQNHLPYSNRVLLDGGSRSRELTEKEGKLLQDLGSTEIFKFVHRTVKADWPDVCKDDPYLVSLGASCLVLEACDAAQFMSMVRSLPRADDISTLCGASGFKRGTGVALAKSLGLYISAEQLSDADVVDLLWACMTTCQIEMVSDKYAVAEYVMRDHLRPRIWAMLQVDPTAPAAISPIPKSLEMLTLAVHPLARRTAWRRLFGDVGGVMYSFVESPCIKLLVNSAILVRYDENEEDMPDEDPIDKEEFEQGELLCVWPCGHCCRAENALEASSASFFRTCQVCGRQSQRLMPFRRNGICLCARTWSQAKRLIDFLRTERRDTERWLRAMDDVHALSNPDGPMQGPPPLAREAGIVGPVVERPFALAREASNAQ